MLNIQQLKLLKECNLTITKITCRYRFFAWKNEDDIIYFKTLLTKNDILSDHICNELNFKYEYGETNYNIHIDSKTIIFNDLDYDIHVDIIGKILSLLDIDILTVPRFTVTDFKCCIFYDCYHDLEYLNTIFVYNNSVCIENNNNICIKDKYENLNKSLHDLKYIKLVIIIPYLLCLGHNKYSIFKELPLEVINIIIVLLKRCVYVNSLNDMEYDITPKEKWSEILH